MADITVVGVGPGHKDYLTRAAVEAAQKAEVLVGGRRQLELFKDSPAEKYVIARELDIIFNIIKDGVEAGKKVVVLASGDPGFYSILCSLKQNLPNMTTQVIPGISSIQLACAKLGIAWDDAFLTSCHGRDYTALVTAVQANKKVITLTDSQRNPISIARKLRELGIKDRPVYVACNLSDADESILKTTLFQLVATKEWQLNKCVMVIGNV